MRALRHQLSSHALHPVLADRQPFRSAPGEDRVWTEELDRIFREVELRN